MRSFLLPWTGVQPQHDRDTWLQGGTEEGITGFAVRGKVPTRMAKCSRFLPSFPCC